MKAHDDIGIQGGFKWGPFVARVPLLHTRVQWPEMLQGMFIVTATVMAFTPLLMGVFGLTLSEAVAMTMMHFVLITASTIVFGEPYAGGWVTPALPLSLAFVIGATDDNTARFQLMTALSMDLAFILFLFGITGFGSKCMKIMPTTIKAGIILGGALAAFKRVFLDDFDQFMQTPFTTGGALVVCLVLSFSTPLLVIKKRSKILAKIVSFGLLPGFLAAVVIGQISGEIQYDIKPGLLEPSFVSLWSKISPLMIGWPSIEMFFSALPLAFIVYIILFGDIVTGMEIIKEAKSSRPDEEIDFNATRTHLSLSIRNIVMALFAPFFPSQGILFTGVQVIIVQRWKEGKASLDSLYSGISSYYILGLPLLLVCYPLVSFLQPLLWSLLFLTFILTGFACANVAMAMPKTPIERGATFLTAVSIVLFQPWIGLLIGLASSVMLVGLKKDEVA